MPRRTEERIFTASGRTLKVTATQLDVLDGFEVLTRVLEIIGPAAGLIPALARGAEALAHVDGSELGEAVQHVVAKLNDRVQRETFMYLSLRGCECIVVDEQRKVQNLASKEGMNDAFDADLLAACDVVGFALMVQFGNFFDVVSERWKARVAKAKAAAAAEASKAKSQRATATTSG